MRRYGVWTIGMLCSTALVGILMSASGCESGGAGSELSVKPRPQLITQTDTMTMKLPGEQRFNIALPRASRAPGAEGEAEADAQAAPDGTARAHARAAQAGTAEALFQVGHALRNDSRRQADFEFDVRFDYEVELHTDSAVALPDAQLGLRLYARDDLGRLLRDVAFVDHSTEDGPVRQSADEHVRFTLTLGPERQVHVFVAGQVKVDIDDGRSAGGTLKLSGLEMGVTVRPAPAVKAADDEQS